MAAACSGQVTATTDLQFPVPHASRQDPGLLENMQCLIRHLQADVGLGGPASALLNQLYMYIFGHVIVYMVSCFPFFHS